MEDGGSGKVVVLVDMDCFYVQVEKRLHPELKDKPCAIVQYNKWQGGSIIAVDYEARKYGVKRSLKGKEAKEKCPGIHLVQVPEKRRKADLSNYRKASGEVMKVLSGFTSVIERASIDEAFLDLTEPVKDYINSNSFDSLEFHADLKSTHVAGCNDDDDTHKDDCDLRISRGDWFKSSCSSDERVLIVAAILVQRIRETILNEVGFTCSAGISHNKMLAKLAAGMHKPNQQTILPQSQVDVVFSTTLLKKVRHLGGKLGEQVQDKLKIECVGQLQEYSLKVLQEKFGLKTGSWLYELCRGICHEKISNRIITKSIGCGKNFPGPSKLKTAKAVKYWLEQLSRELVERLEEDMTENTRQAQSITVHFLPEGQASSVARTFALPSYNTSLIVNNSWNAINKGHKPVTNEESHLTWTTGILNIHLSAGKFVQCGKGHMKSLLQLMSSDQECSFVSASSSHSSIITGKEVTQMTLCKEEREDAVLTTTPTITEQDQSLETSSMNITKFFTPIKRKGSLETQLDRNAKRREVVLEEIKGTLESDDDTIIDNQFEAVLCSECGEEVLKFVLEEHMDYHFALSLDKDSQIN
ncbi:PREDICTED: DNA polymerase eta-like [Amphimedon queenslandica]|nr:PREDICTED: DNA polymerase eta-like [Amphimedon queenslandica]|eukprot:XP_003382583.1 PREDICTED: DNA polymerase eta-like [Amphimedon queenslandica]